jgi:hypothetical protein
LGIYVPKGITGIDDDDDCLLQEVMTLFLLDEAKLSALIFNFVF